MPVGKLYACSKINGRMIKGAVLKTQIFNTAPLAFSLFTFFVPVKTGSFLQLRFL